MSSDRRSGVLLHVTSLPGPYGAGDFGTSARNFAKFLKEAGFSLWQILPLTPVLPVFGNSPYSSPSAFAGNAALISPELLFEDGLLTRGEIDRAAVPSGRAADFAAASEIRARLVALAWERFRGGACPQMSEDFEKFKADEKYWLRDYALYSLLKKKNGERCWTEWPAALAAHDEAAIAGFEAANMDELSFIAFAQFIFFRQLGALSASCAELGVELMGDAPIYVAWDGADVWAARGLFDLEADGRPRCVAGVPPDYFSETGQRWGNPLYKWEEMRRDGFAWWRSRLRHLLKYCATVRIDHFRGLSAFWEIPAECETAKDGRWRPALGGEMLETFRREDCGGRELPVVAEDLGIITDDVRELMARFGLPGMKVLMFAFGGSVAENPYAPHNVEQRSVIYTGTHDNDTAAGWWSGSSTAQERGNFALYTGRDVDAGNAAEIMTRMALSSTAELAVIPAQDILGLGAGCRMNRPSVPKGNWGWRLTAEEAARLRDKAEPLRGLNGIYGRLRQ